MKKSFLALAVAALAASSIASTASAATVYDKDGTSLAVYGRVQSVLYSDKAGVHFDNNSAKGDDEATIKTSGRLGIDMRTQVFGDIAAFGKMEWDVADGNVDPGKDDSFGARYLWVGLDFAQAGQVKFGRFEPAFKYAISQTDIFDDWGCAGLAGNDDKRKAVVQYQWSGMGFDFIGSYVFANKDEHVDGGYARNNKEQFDMDYAVSFAAGYTSPDVLFGPIAIRAGYEKGEMAETAANLLSGSDLTVGHMYDSYDSYAVGLSWGSLNVGPYIAAQYVKREFDINGLLTASGQTTKNANQTEEVTGYEFAVGYGFANGVAIRAGYTHQTYEYNNVEVEAATIPVYVNWQLNPQFNVWAEARFDASTDENDKENNKDFGVYTHKEGDKLAENMFSAGLRYQF